MAWAPWFIRTRRDRERQEELEAHLAHHIDDLIGRGVDPAEARRQARVLFGNPRARREELDDMQRLPIVDVVSRDLRYAFRTLRRSPGFAFTAIATLAVVIGANTAVFSLANGLLLKPLPFPESERLVLLRADFEGPDGNYGGTSVDGRSWQAISTSPWGTQAALFTNWTTGVSAGVSGRGVFVDQQRVSAGFFATLGVAPARGREFEVSEDVPNGPSVAILSHGLWMQAFGGAPDAIGKTILLRGEPWQVVGVMPEGFRGTTDADIWTPLRPSTRGEGGGTNYQLLLRLPAGTSIERAEAELGATFVASLRNSGLKPEVKVTTGLMPLQDYLAASSRDPIVMLGAAVLTVMVIACVNLAALMLARAGSRSKEIATRMAIGSGRTAVVRQLMIESLVIAGFGGLAGSAVGWLGLQGLQTLGGDRFSDWQRVSIDTTVLVGTAALAVVASLVFGLVPAWQASRVNVNAAMGAGGSRGVAGGAKPWLRRGLIIGEVALGVVLLVAAGLLLRTFVNLRSVDPGFEPQGLSTASVSLLDARYPGPVEVNRLFDSVLERLRSTPGVESATVSLGLPYERVLNMGFLFPGEKPKTTSVMYVSPDFFDTLRMDVRRGRRLESGDRADRRPVVVVNESFARLFSPSQDVLGRLVRVAGAEREIIGVVGDIQLRPGFVLTGMVPGPIVASPTVYLPAGQVPTSIVATHVWFSPVFTVRAASHQTAVAAIETAVASSDPMLPLGLVRPMVEVQSAATAEQRLLMSLVGAIALAALLLSAIGLHGLIAHSVQERTREFGIRLALGATARGAMSTVVAGGLGLAAIGAAIGALLAAPATTMVASVLYGVPQRDPGTYAGAILFLLTVAALASLLPALRILKLDPAVTLRQ